MFLAIIGTSIPVGKYTYNGHTYLVSVNRIEKSKAFYPEQYETIASNGLIVSSDTIIATMQLKGLARTIGVI